MTYEVEVKTVLRVEVDEEDVKSNLEEGEDLDGAIKEILEEEIESQMSNIELHDYHIESIKKIITLREKDVVEEGEET